MALSSSELWTLGTDVSAKPSQRQLAIYALLARGRYARDEMESVYRSLVHIAARAYIVRDIDAVNLASQVILALPFSDKRKNLARYYQAFCLARKGELEAARQATDRLLDEELTTRLHSRVLLIKAATHWDAGEIEQSLPFYVEAGHVARDCDQGALLTSLRMAAIIKGVNGDHNKAVADLEALVPLAYQISKHDAEALAATLNSYAVELGEIGQVEQGLNVVSKVAAFSRLVPEIPETASELRSKLPTRKHSIVVIHKPEPARSAEIIVKPVRQHITQSLFIIREAERRFTAFRAPPVQRGRLTPSSLAPSDPARQPTKPRAP